MADWRVEVQRSRGAAADWWEEPGWMEAWVLSKRRGESCAGRWEAAGQERRTAAGQEEVGRRSIAARLLGRWEEATAQGQRTHGARRYCRWTAARLETRCWSVAGSCVVELQTVESKDQFELSSDCNWSINKSINRPY